MGQTSISQTRINHVGHTHRPNYFTTRLEHNILFIGKRALGQTRVVCECVRKVFVIRINAKYH